MDFHQQREALSSVVAIPTTPFAPDGRIDAEGYRRVIRRLVDGGVTTVTPNGNTGEFYALSPKEASVVTRLAIEAAGPGTTVIVGVGHDLDSASRRPERRGDAGATMVMVHQPVHPYVSPEGWIEYHRLIARAVPELGVVLYVRNAAIAGSAFARLGESCPNVIGVKYAVADPAHFARTAADAGQARFTWVAGLAELSAPGYAAAGASGFTSGLANVYPAISLALWRALAEDESDLAARSGEQVRPFEELRAVEAGPTTSRWSKRRSSSWSVLERGAPAELDAAREPCGSRSRRSSRAGGSGRCRQARGAAERQMVRRRRAARLQPPVPDPPAGHRGRGARRQAGDRDPQHLERDQPLPHASARRAQEVKRGVLEAGGYPVELPVATLSETFQKPTPMLYRNLLAMDTEELLRSYPLDGAVLMGGCDKSTPALLMGAASVDRPVIFVPAGPMLTGHWHGETLGSGTDMWRFWDEKRAGTITQAEWETLESALARSPGQCMTMGTASTMTSAAEALGMTLPGAASIPAVDSAHHRNGGGERLEDRGHGRREPQDVGGRDQGGLLGRRDRRAGARRLDQRRDPPRRHGAPLRGRAEPGRLRPPLAFHPGARQHPARGRVSDGGLLLRGRPSGAHGPHRRPLASRAGDGQRPHDGRQHRRGGRVRRPGDPHEGQPRGRGRGPGDPPRQPRAERSGDQALCGLARTF